MNEHDKATTVDGLLRRMREILFVTPEEAEDHDEDDLIRALCDAADCFAQLQIAIAAERSTIATEDADLVARGVHNAGRLADVPKPRWAHVTEALAVGSTRAHELCHRFGLDPSEIVPREYAGEVEGDHAE